MNAKNPKFAIAPKGEYNSVVADVKYLIVSIEEEDVNGNIFFEIISPLAKCNILCVDRGCAHLGGKDWILTDK